MLSNLFVVTTLFCLFFSENVYGQTCTNYLDEISCENVDLCRWISSIDGDDYCGCASSIDLNVIFAMDESGSVGSSDFADQIDFVEELILTALEPDDSIALITFGSSVNLDYSFSDSQIEADVLSGLNSISYSGGLTPTLSALNLAITEFNDNGDPNKENVLFLITDGVPSSPRPCDNDVVKTALDAAEVTVVIIGVGSFNIGPITCLVDDESQIIEVDGFSLESFEAVRDLTDAFLCPEGKTLGIPECEGSKCDCTDEAVDPNCKICHYENGPGCSQCERGYFKLDYNYPCTDCQEVFGEGCKFCQDFNGCGQCKRNYVLRYDEDLGVNCCFDCFELYGEGCRVCQKENCGQCKNGYDLVENEEGTRVCVESE